MKGMPAWLPPMFPVDPWTADTFEHLYRLFRNDFVASRPRYRGREIWFFPGVEDGREKIFWHLTHREDSETGVRLPDFRRAERLPWARPIIEYAGNPEILTWDYREGNGDIHTYVWLKDFDYLIIMKKYNDGGRRLITAYWIEYSNKKQKLEKKFRRRIPEP